MMRTSQLAFVLAGFAATISLGSLFHVRSRMSSVQDDLLRLKVENEALRQRIEVSETQVMGAMVGRLDQLRVDLGLPGSEPSEEEVAPYPEALISAIGRPERKEGVTRVQVPAEVWTAVMGEPERLAAEVTLTPEVEAGRPAGYKVYEARSGGLAVALGLELGDVIRSVNGKPFRSEAEIAAVWAGLPSSKKVEFDLLRGGKPARLVVEVGP